MSVSISIYFFQIAVRGSQCYFSTFHPKHFLYLGSGCELEFTDLLFDTLRRDRKILVDSKHSGRSCKISKSHKSRKATAVAVSKPLSLSWPSCSPYRYLWPQRGCVLASPVGHLGFCSANWLQGREDVSGRIGRLNQRDQSPTPCPPCHLRVPGLAMGGAACLSVSRACRT